MDLEVFPTGTVIGDLTLVREEPRHKTDKRRMVLVRCKCGQTSVVRLTRFKLQTTKTCGCLVLETVTKHGQNRRLEPRTRLYNIWAGMVGRSTEGSANQRGAMRCYAGVGRSPLWDTFEGFLANPPLADSPFGEPRRSYDDEMQLCRTDDTGDYTPENTRWDTRANNIRERGKKT